MGLLGFIFLFLDDNQLFVFKSMHFRRALTFTADFMSELTGFGNFPALTAASSPGQQHAVCGGHERSESSLNKLHPDPLRVK